jgi:hypothetical protein
MLLSSLWIRPAYRILWNKLGTGSWIFGKFQWDQAASVGEIVDIIVIVRSWSHHCRNLTHTSFHGQINHLSTRKQKTLILDTFGNSALFLQTKQINWASTAASTLHSQSKIHDERHNCEPVLLNYSIQWENRHYDLVPPQSPCVISVLVRDRSDIWMWNRVCGRECHRFSLSSKRM